MPADMIAEGLTAPKRIMLFCVATPTDWQRAGVTHARAALEALMMRAPTRW
jgi:hypothetical protein